MFYQRNQIFIEIYIEIEHVFNMQKRTQNNS